MNKFKKIYPVFEDIIITMIVIVDQRLEFENLSNPKIVFYRKVNDLLYPLLEKFTQKPSISNVTIESHIKDLIDKDPTIEGVILKVELVKNPDYLRFGTINLNLKK